jgi:hypothetical protein
MALDRVPVVNIKRSQDYWDLVLSPSSGILQNTSILRHVVFFEIPNDGQNAKTQESLVPPPTVTIFRT